MSLASNKYLLIAIFVAVLLSVTGFLTFPRKIERTVIKIEKGETAIDVAKKLSDAKLIKYPITFKIVAALTKSDKKLKPGKYIFDDECNVFIALDKITSGDYELRRVTIPEGLSLDKTLNIISNMLVIPRAVLDSLAVNSQFCERLTGLKIPNLEGFLYPETYLFEDDTKADEALETMVKLALKKFKEAEVGRLEQLSYYQTIILASIVEAEAKNRDEMPLIADVYLKRLKLKMKLGASPTIQYLLEKKGVHRDFLYYKDTEIDSPYNTYLYLGLPPTPICSPSLYAVNAVLNPAKTDYLYFFADGKGGHIFTTSYQEHLDQRKHLRREKASKRQS
ncbi:MAG: endolytic transglycosylase MltG [Candidatus Cloacimonetes bacterium]|nr:endolytic transglycosylase MltG [Candidatus Cloacimonadota bacterium]